MNLPFGKKARESFDLTTKMDVNCEVVLSLLISLTLRGKKCEEKLIKDKIMTFMKGWRTKYILSAMLRMRSLNYIPC